MWAFFKFNDLNVIVSVYKYQRMIMHFLPKCAIRKNRSKFYPKLERLGYV